MYSYPITPEQLKVMWNCLAEIAEEYGGDAWEEYEVYTQLKDYFKEED